MNNDTSISSLKDLHELLGDGKKGYAEAAERVKPPNIAEFLSHLSQDRAEMQRDLAMNIQRLQPAFEKLDSGTIKGNLHRAWMDIREAIARSEDGALLAECMRGEGYLLKRYSSILEDTDTPSEVLRLLREQMTRIDLTLSSIEQLRSTVQSNAS